VQRVTGLRSSTTPPLTLVGLDQISLGHPDQELGHFVERGRYQRLTRTIETRNIFGLLLRREQHATEQVRVLYGLSEEQFLSTACHELTHDLIAEFFPNISGNVPAWVEEGVCQYVAAVVCRRLGLSAELAEIEISPHPVYGRGYRFFSHHFGPDNWGAVSRWLLAVDPSLLPDECPVR
jgi:hypothetical protein